MGSTAEGVGTDDGVCDAAEIAATKIASGSHRNELGMRISSARTTRVLCKIRPPNGGPEREFFGNFSGVKTGPVLALWPVRGTLIAYAGGPIAQVDGIRGAS